jgi:tetratricopeptide (TPR) repeat protein
MGAYMSLKLLKTLFESQKFQEVLEKITQLEYKNEFSSLPEEEQAECLYYKSWALEGMGEVEEALKQITSVQMKFSHLNPGLILMFLSTKFRFLKQLNRLDELEEVLQEGDRIIKNFFEYFSDSLDSLEIYWTRENLEQSLNFFREGLRFRRTRKDKEGIASSYFCIGELYLSHLQFIRQKIPQKSIDQALDNFKRSLQFREKTGNKKALAEILRSISRAYLYKNDLDQALKYSKESLELYEELDNKKGLADIFTLMRWIFTSKGDFDRQIELCKKRISLYERMGNKKEIAGSYLTLHAKYDWVIGESDLAMHYLQKASDIYEELADKKQTTMLLYWFGAHHIRLGNLNLAIEYFKKGLEITEEYAWKEMNAIFLHSFGWFYCEKGELNLAKEYCHRSITLFEEITETSPTYEWIVWPLLNLGLAHHSEGNFTTALKFYKRSLAINKEFWIPNIFCVSEILFQLISLSIDMNSPDQAKIYFQELKDHLDQFPSRPYLYNLYLTAEAIFLKSSTRLKDRVKAQELLQRVVDAKLSFHRLTTIARLHLVELLLYEVKWLGNEETYRKVKSLTYKLGENANDQNLVDLRINTLIILAQFEVIEGNFLRAVELLDIAMEIAKENDLNLLVEKITEQQLQFEAELEKWEVLIQRNAPLKERLEQARFERYIEEVKAYIIHTHRLGKR